MIRAVILLGVLSMATPVMGQSFSCSMGARPACLGFGETVCSSSGMCVNQNSACFDRYQCNFEGFTCRSNLTECVDRYERLLREHNDLVRDYNALLADHRTLLSTHNDLVDEYNQNLAITRRLRSELADVETCLILARTLEDARLCAP
ncbi:hypothetical protein [Cereibacter sphaeroides]|uniref:hypothetical protein n=1 Tax=Cereibacter sphaeroides TaxID=1063 RepID=UPI000191CA06|nr:hypothetical protein [Cereibacter sphaeroides]ACM03923.1 Hypothetical Protein RSKD131_4063 [Cereibacter sphaeroides KD131]